MSFKGIQEVSSHGRCSVFPFFMADQFQVKFFQNYNHQTLGLLCLFFMAADQPTALPDLDATTVPPPDGPEHSPPPPAVGMMVEEQPPRASFEGRSGRTPPPLPLMGGGVIFLEQTEGRKKLKQTLDIFLPPGPPRH